MGTNSDVMLDLTLVIDIGKSNAKLLLLDEAGNVVERHSRANTSVTSPLGYPALDVHGLQQWMQHTLRASPNALRCGHAIASTHGAAIVALGEAALAWPPLDYEFEAVALAGADHTSFQAASNFRETLSPELPAGLNAARQLHWMQATHPEAWRGTRTLMPYAQYWAWLLSGVACSEVSSLGCHTHLWNPQDKHYSSLAVAKGWAALFAPLHSAWEVVGTVGTERAALWGLSPACQVHVGVHDSNACLARYVAEQGDAQSADAVQALTVVSSGTWTVLMAPGACADSLRAEQDMLGNVDVTGRMTPTARFMGGREFEALLDGADAQAASWQDLQALLDNRLMALPAFSQSGGPFASHGGFLEQGGRVLPGRPAVNLDAPQRAALAALYCAQVTAWLIDFLWGQQTTGPGRVVVEGPLAHNTLYLLALQGLLPTQQCLASTDAVEGTARGAWMLAHWGADVAPPILQRVSSQTLPGLADYHQHWMERANVLLS